MSEKRQKCLQAVKQAFVTVKSVAESDVTESALVVAQLGLESIDIVDVAFEIENILSAPVDLNEFLEGIRAKTGKLHNDFSVGQLVDFLETRCG